VRWQAAQNSPWIAGILAAAGGFLDAFTYFGHGRVFANAMSGNVVLLGVAAATGDWRQSYRHLQPILAFLLGVAAAQTFRLPRMAKVRDPAIACLTLEMVFLFAAGWLPIRALDLPLVLGISFLAALQSSTFPRIEKWGYNSTMTTGNLRVFGEAGFDAIFSRPNVEAAHKAKLYGAICLAFLGGATLGAMSTAALENRALWVADIVLLVAWFPLVRARRTA